MIFSVIGGASSAGIIAVINYAIANFPDLPPGLLWLFVGLCLGLLIFGTIAFMAIVRLSQEVMYHLRLKLTQQILACPLQHLETVGTPKLLATLTEDLNTIGAASAKVAGLAFSSIADWLFGVYRRNFF